MAVTKLQHEYTQAAEAMHRQRAELEAQLASAGAELAEVTPPPCPTCISHLFRAPPWQAHSTKTMVPPKLLHP